MGSTTQDEMLDQVLFCDQAADASGRRDDADDQPCALPACGQPTALRLQHKHWGPVPLCADCWDTVVHGEMPAAGPDGPSGRGGRAHSGLKP